LASRADQKSYRLPELIAAAPDVPNVAALGLIATTNSEGAGKWASDLNKWFAGRQIVSVLEDNDSGERM
jgi:hypothetical protein